jgi:hypothetical protein
VHSDDSGEWLGDLAYRTLPDYDDGTVNEESVRQGPQACPWDDSRCYINAHNQQVNSPFFKIAQELNFQPDIWIDPTAFVSMRFVVGLPSSAGYLESRHRNRNQDYVDYPSLLQAAQRQQGRTP